MVLELSVSDSIVVAIPTLKPPTKISKLGFCRFRSSANDSTEKKFPFKIPPQLLKTKWKFNDFDPDDLKRSLNSLLSRTHNFVNEVASPLVKPRKPDPSADVHDHDIEDIFVGEQTIQSELPSGNLSLAAVVSIEQFSRMNGMTGKKMQKIFGALVPKSVHNEARNLVEYCCFRFLSRDNPDIHPCLEDLAFQRLIFITMLAWETPLKQERETSYALEEASLKTRLVGEDAFIRIAPAVAGVADRSTVHNLYKALAGDEGGVSFRIWCSYIRGLLKYDPSEMFTWWLMVFVCLLLV